MRHLLTRLLAAAAIFSVALAPNAAMAANVFYGITVHVSTNNIKVRDPRTGQVLSFTLLPKFDQVFSDDGKTTYQMRRVHAGSYVAIVYDQKALGMRHADKIYVMNNANERIRTE